MLPLSRALGFCEVDLPIRLVILMPRKIRQLIRDLKSAGFINRGGKGSHKNYEHPKGMRVTISGNLGDDTKPYQEKEVKRRIEESQR